MIDDTTHLQRVMDDLAEGRTRELDRGRTYLITAPLLLHFDKPVSDARLLGNGAIIESQITDGSPIWRIDALLANDWVKRFDFYDLTIYGSGKDGNGIEVYAPGEQGGISRCGWHNITVEGAGLDGWNFTGAIFESLAENCGSEKNGRNGVTVANTTAGILSAMRWSGGSRLHCGECAAWIRDLWPARSPRSRTLRYPYRRYLLPAQRETRGDLPQRYPASDQLRLRAQSMHGHRPRHLGAELRYLDGLRGNPRYTDTRTTNTAHGVLPRVLSQCRWQALPFGADGADRIRRLNHVGFYEQASR